MVVIFELSQATRSLTPASHLALTESFVFIVVLKRSTLHIDLGVFGGIEQRHQVIGMYF